MRFYLKNKKATKKVYKKSGVDLKALILALGGYHNILETSSTMSKVTVVLKEGYNKLKKGAIPLLAIYLFVFGGSGFGFEFPGLAKGIINTIEEYRTMETEVELKKEELKGKQLENYKAAMEVINMSKDTENDIDIDKVLKDLKLIDELNDSLKFESNIDFAKGIKESEE